MEQITGADKVKRKKRNKKLTFSEKGACVIIAVAFAFLFVVIVIGWLILGREEVAYISTGLCGIITGCFIVFEIKAKAENEAMFAKLERKDLYQVKEQEKETEKQNENMEV